MNLSGNATILPYKNDTQTFAVNTTEHDPAEYDVAFFVYYYGIFFILTCINIPGNLIVITTVLKHQQLRQPCNYCIASLAVSDFLIGIVYPVYNISHLEEVPNLSKNLGSWGVCRFLVCQVLALEICSSYHLVAITVTRYIAIVHPLRYHIYVTTKTVTVTMAVIWILSQGSSIGMYTMYSPETPVKVCRYELIFSVTHVIILLMIQLFIPLLIMLVLYAKIAQIARKQARSIAAQECSVSGQVRTISGIIKNELKSTIMVSLLLGFFALSWTPMIVYFFYTIACPSPPCTANKYIRATVRVLLYLNSSVNVFIYAGRLSEFRRRIKSDLYQFFSLCCKSIKPVESKAEIHLVSTMSKLSSLNEAVMSEVSFECNANYQGRFTIRPSILNRNEEDTNY